MLLVAIGGDGDLLHRHRHLRRRDIAQFEDSWRGICGRRRRSRRAVPAGSSASTATGRRRRLEIAAGGFEHAVRRVLGVDLGIAFVGKNDEAEAARQTRRAFPDRQDRRPRPADWRRSEIDRDRARQQLVGERVEIGQEAGRLRSPADRPARNRPRSRPPHRPHRTDWGSAPRACGTLYRRRAAARNSSPRCAARNRPSREPLSTSTSFAGIDRPRGSAKRLLEPVGRGLRELIEAFVHRIAAELVDMRGNHRAHERRHSMLRLTDREADRGLARRRVAKQLAQPHERRARIRCTKRRGTVTHCFPSQTAGVPPAASGTQYHRSGEVKTRLTIKISSVYPALPRQESPARRTTKFPVTTGLDPVVHGDSRLAMRPIGKFDQPSLPHGLPGQARQ